jgi:hypothetical protein
LGFSLALGLAVKPYRLLFPDFAPAVSAGLRPLRVGRASARVSLRIALPLRAALALRALVLGFAPALLEPLPLLPWPMFLLHDGAEDLPVRAPLAPLLGRAALPLEWFPFESFPFKWFPFDLVPLLEPLPA